MRCIDAFQPSRVLRSDDRAVSGLPEILSSGENHGAGPDDPPGRHLDRVADPGREEYIGSTCGGLTAAAAAVDNGAI